ncbi:MAG: ribosome biogenesis GTPase Der [Candidatus Kuenenbacteria bacterium]
MIKTISIIGRANVGKSTLFNRLTEKRHAMISDIPGTTRDLKYATIEWQGEKFELIDTGGFLAEQKPLRDMTKKQEKKFQKEKFGDIDKQVEAMAKKALEKSKIVFFIVDGKEGLNPQDRQIAGYLRKVEDKEIILVVNKCDNPKIRQTTAEFHKLGLGEPMLVSAVNGSGTGDLLDKISEKLTAKKGEDAQEEQEPLHVSIIGKPNVGKSSLLNKILGEEKAIVSPIAHTTREPNDTLIEYQGRKILLVDTAGIRRKARVIEKSLESLGVSMSIGSIKRSAIVLLLLDISENISRQDLTLGKLASEAGAGVVIVANKYDLVKNEEEELEDVKNLTKKYTDYIYQNFPHLDWAPIIFASAQTGFNVQKILKLILEVEKQKQIHIPAGALSKFLKSAIRHQPPPRKRIGDGSKTKIKRAFITHFEQINAYAPTFICTIGSKEKLPEEYRKYIINQLRRKFGFKGVSIKLVVRWKNPN